MTRYEQTVSVIQQYISGHRLRPGDRLPPETELAKLAGVSLITVRRAMSELASRGLVRREQGRGTYVQATLIDTETTRLGSLTDTLGGSRELGTQLLRVVPRRSTHAESEALALGRSDKVWEVVRLRTIDEEPVILEVAHVPVVLAPRLDQDVAARHGGSLYGLLAQEYGLEEGHEEQTLVVEEASPQAAAHLRLQKGDPSVVVSGVSYTIQGVPFDAFRLTFKPARFAFHLRSTPQSTLVALPAQARSGWAGA